MISREELYGVDDEPAAIRLGEQRGVFEQRGDRDPGAVVRAKGLIAPSEIGAIGRSCRPRDGDREGRIARSREMILTGRLFPAPALLDRTVGGS